MSIDDDSDLPAVCSNSKFRIKVRDKNHENKYETTVKFTIDGNGDQTSANTSDRAESWVYRIYEKGISYDGANPVKDLDITAENANECSNSIVARIKIYPNPTVMLSANTTTSQDWNPTTKTVFVCRGNNGTINATATGGATTGFTYYNYYTNVAQTGHSSNVEAFAKGSYQVEYVDGNGCKSKKSDPIIIDEYSEPNFRAYTDPSMVCGDQSTEVYIDEITVNGETYPANKQGYGYKLLTKYGVTGEAEGADFSPLTNGKVTAHIQNYKAGYPFGVKVTYGKNCPAKDIVHVEYTNAPVVQYGLFADKIISGLNPSLDRNITSTSGETNYVEGLNPTNLGGIYSYLTLVAQNNNISVEDLLNDPKNSEILKGALSDYEEVGELLLSIDDLSPENYQKQLNDMYNGNLYEGQNKVMTASSIDIIKSYVDHISQESGIKVEDLLTNTDYASALKEGTQEFAKASSFMGVQATNCGKDGNPVVSNLFNGKNQAALGMTSDEVNSFKAEVDALASSNGVDSNTLLTDSKYADSVSELVNKSGNTVGIGSMFGKCESSKMQNVANNIYNTEYVTTETRSVEQEEFASSVELEG